MLLNHSVVLAAVVLRVVALVGSGTTELRVDGYATLFLKSWGAGPEIRLLGPKSFLNSFAEGNTAAKACEISFIFSLKSACLGWLSFLI